MSRFFELVADAADGFAMLFKSRGDSYVDLETAEIEHNPKKDAPRDLRCLVRPDGSLVSLIEIQGARRLIGPKEFDRFMQDLYRLLSPPLSREGHQVEIVFRRDYGTTRKEIEKALTPSRRTARRLQMDVDWILDARRDTLESWCASEAVWIAVSTNYRIFSASESRNAGKERGEKIAANPIGKDSQNMAGSPASMRAAHLAMVGNMVRALDGCNILARWLPSHEALWVIRREFDPEATSDQWRPLLPGDPLPARMPITNDHKDPTSLLYPRMKRQLIPRTPGKILRNRWIEIGDRIHAPVAMSLPPQEIQSFDGLLGPLIESHTPFRISFTLMPGGVHNIGMLKRQMAPLVDWTSTINKQFRAAMETLKVRFESGETLIGMRVLADTWVEGEDTDTLQIRSEYLAKALQSWGHADTTDITGDPLAAVCATIPGMTRDNPAPVSVPPLGEIVGMLPLSRPASPWRQGTILLRSPDGRILPYQPGSKLQTSWVTLGFAAMGKGKSVFLNVHNLALALQGGLDRLPYIAILDIGPSSTGLISLLQHSLPPTQRHLVMHHRMQMTPENAINPFETPLGLSKPLPEHRATLVNLLTTLATPEGETKAQDGIPGIAQMVVDRVFEQYAPGNNPKRYDPRQDPDLAQRVQEHGIEVDPHTTWYEIRDALFDIGDLEGAQQAHSLAMPILGDCGQIALDSSITSVYAGTTSTNESMGQYFWRSINEAISRYPVLARPTRLRIGQARIVALDLADVCPKGGPAAVKQAGIMFSLARYALVQRYYLDENSVPHFPERYQAHYARMTREMKGEPKIFSMDEYHRTGGVDGFRKSVETDIREGRKFWILIALFSQNVGDYDDTIVDLSSTRVVLGAETPNEAEEVSRRFGLTESAADIIFNQITKPGPEGSALYLSARTEVGNTEMFANLTLGPVELWAFNTNAKDRELRDTLYQRLGPRQTLEALARRFPSGSAVTEIEARRERMGDRAGNTVIDQMVTEIQAEASALAA